MYDHAGNEVSAADVLSDDELADYYAHKRWPVAIESWQPFLPKEAS